MSYNIRNGRGADGRVDLERIAAVIRAFSPDVVALQEVDDGRERSGRADQASELAERLEMRAEYCACVERGRERYGIATLTKLPVIETHQHALPIHAHRRSEPRRALVTRLAWPDAGTTTAMVNTHLSIVRAERPGQIAAIDEMVTDTDLIVAGDLNCTPWSRALRPLHRRMRSATGRARSWPARAPLVPIDHILIAGPLNVVEAGSWKRGDARIASDHLPVVAVLEAA